MGRKSCWPSMEGTGYKTATKAALAADGERHRCLLQSVPYMRRAQPISCKCATSARNRPEIAVIQRPRGLHAPILVTSHTHTHTDSNNCNMTLDKGMSHQESSRPVAPLVASGDTGLLYIIYLPYCMATIASGVLDHLWACKTHDMGKWCGRAVSDEIRISILDS